ncbi:KTSC domain-containing protein [Leifsonia sp. NPDC080035]|uniref:KTSC domain-containing protein n=1 Tax=Leifsonia sp. NPDC080035 TaxID=3143936 RepID=A0AAU7GA24_9MICO
MHRVAFDSSAIVSAGYDTDTSTLEVEFTSGGIYCYRLVPARVWRELREAPSPGRYFSERIRDVYPEEWLPHAT